VPRLFHSDDGRWRIAFPAMDSQNRRPLAVGRYQGTDSDWRIVDYLRTQGNVVVAAEPYKFTFDGEWLVYYNRDADGKDGLYRVATEGGDPVRLGDYPTNNPGSYLAVSPDGRRFIVQVRIPAGKPEFWIVDNVIPKAVPTPAKASTKAVTR